jgi:hypothetical protein
MTPTLPEILTGVVVTLSTPPSAESSGDFHTGMAGVCVMLSVLAGQEAERGPAAAAWENAAMQRLFARAAEAYDEGLGGQLDRAGSINPGDGSLTALAAANAELRRTLIALHEAVESARDGALDREILHLYADMAAQRRLDLPLPPS